jgi:MoaA/NifB/PqqE/SkfB family radical SAM enzyme
MQKKNFKENLDLVGALDGSRAYKGPDIVQIDLTDKCNLNCVGCWCHSDLLGESKLKEFKELPYDLVKKIIEDLHDGGVKEIMISGSGEPFMHPKIVDIISLIKKKGIRLNIVTNFTLINKEIIKKLVELKADNITASIWAGDAETYVKTHPNQTKETFEKIKENLKYLHSVKKENNLPNVKIYNVISKFNYNHLKEMLDFALETSVDYIEFQVADIIPEKTDSLRLDERDKKNILSQVMDFKKRKEYFDVLIGTQHLKKFNKKHYSEFMEFGRFFKNTLEKGFDLRFNEKKAICPRGYSSLRMDVDQTKENAFKFKFSEELCKTCPSYKKCDINKENFTVKEEFLNLLGFGSFFRRISNQNEKGNYDSNIIDSVPCYVGWIYARILTNGDITPCCKAHLFPLGNLHKKSFKEIWFSKKYDEFRKKAKKLKKSDKYFSKIGCYKGCDNLGMNLEMHRRMKDLSLFEKIRVLIKK